MGERQMGEVARDTLNGAQERALRNVESHLIWGMYDVKEMSIETCWKTTVSVAITRGVKNDEGTMAQVFCRDTYVFFIGGRGGVYQFVEGRNGRYRRVYRKYGIVEPLC